MGKYIANNIDNSRLGSGGGSGSGTASTQGTNVVDNRPSTDDSQMDGHSSGLHSYQGTNNDEPGTSSSQDIVMEYVVELPFSAGSCMICLAANSGNFMALSVKESITHHREKHSSLCLKFKCTQCGKMYTRKLAAECHVPKCPGRINVEPLAFNCSECSRTFATRSGLSQHERHEHPRLRNTARAAPSARRIADQGGNRVFSREDIELMLEMEIEFNGETRISKMMAERLTGKTATQVRNKRCEPAYIRRREEFLKDRETLTEENTPPDGIPPIEVGNELSSGQGNVIDGSQEQRLPDPNLFRQPLCPPIRDTTQLNEWRSVICAAVTDSPPWMERRKTSTLELYTLLREYLLGTSSANETSQADIDGLYQRIKTYLLPNVPPSRHSNDSVRRKNRKVHDSRRCRRKFKYARTQDLYKNSPGLLAKYVREGIEFAACEQNNPPNADDVKEYFGNLWGVNNNIILPNCGSQENVIPVDQLFTPLEFSEIKKRISRLKKNVAPGPDGIKKIHLLSKSAIGILQAFFNLVMSSGIQPSEWRKNRTTLLLKEGKDGSNIRNYRPITIGSLLSRIYWGLIDERLRREIIVTPRQKGFTSESGCYNNVHILNEIIRAAKQKAGLVAVQLDIAKAFDTVPHQAIEWALIRKGLPEFVVRHLVDSYKNICTEVRIGTTAVPVQISRGIKQGDPLSPLIFNLVLEPLLVELERVGGFRINNEQGISCLAFADDLVLVAKDKANALEQLRFTESFLRGLGMTVSADKCSCFEIKKTKDSWVVLNPKLNLSVGDELPFTDEESHLTYLGVRISPWRGVDPVAVRDALYTSLQRTKKLYLKPHQKLNLIERFLIPHYLYSLVIATPPITIIREMDQELRVVVRDILHLPQSTANGLIYSRKRDGGLGFPKLEIVITTAALKAGLKFLANTDPAIQALAEASDISKRLKSVANAVRLNWPLSSLKEVDVFKIRAKKEELNRWSKLELQGKSVASVTDDRIGNAWLFNPELLKPSRFITALRLRANVAGNKTTLARTKILQDKTCRRCGTQLETLGHILGLCTHTKAQIIKRHNDIRDLVCDEAAKRNPAVVVIKEPTLKLPSGENLKPDLVIQNQSGVLVVDVSVRHEDGDYLERGRMEKVEKYSPLLPILQSRFQKETAEVLPIIVGTRGAMPNATIRALEALSISDRKTLTTISLMALRSSIELYHQFLDYG